MAESDRTGRLGFGATMAEVAALAGVTKMTVSRVLRHPEKVTPATRARVSEAIATMGYVPNRLAGSLTAGATGLVAAIVPTLRHSLFADTLEGLSDVHLGGRARPHRLFQLLPHRCRGKPDTVLAGAPARRSGADRPHPHQQRARSSQDLRRAGRRDLGNRRRAGRHGGRLFEPQGSARDDGAAGAGRLSDRSSSSTDRATTTNAPGTAPKAISLRCGKQD